MTATGCSLNAPNRIAQVALLPIMPVLLVALIGVFTVSLPNIVDPMTGHDDFPALLAQPDLFWEKTLHEGRWISYLWHLREIVTPAWLNFAVYQSVWALLAAALAIAMMGPITKTSDSRWLACLLALLIVVAPPAMIISLWYNTLVLGLAIVALYAVLGCWVSQRWHRALLVPFTIITLMSYTTYPLILLAVCLARTKHRSVRDLTGLLALFVLSFVLAVLVVYTLNWRVHGVFGIPLADWREAHPAMGLSGLAANVPMIGQTIQALLRLISYHMAPAVGLHLLVMLTATFYLIRRAPMEAIYLHAGLWLGIFLTWVQAVKLGYAVPPRSFTFAWIFYVAIVVRALALLNSAHRRTSFYANAFIVLALAFCLYQTFCFYMIFRPWQSETRSLAEALEQSQGPILLYGDMMTLDSAKLINIYHPDALSLRIEYLTGLRTVFCNDDPVNCAKLQAAAVKWELPTPLVVTVADVDGKMGLTYPIP